MTTGQSTLLNARPAAVWQPRTSVAWQVPPHTLLRAGFGVFGDLLPAGSLIDALAPNPPFVNTFQGGLLGEAGGLAIAPSVPNSAVDATGRRESGLPGRTFAAARCHARRRWRIRARACPPVSVTALPPGGLAVPRLLAVERWRRARVAAGTWCCARSTSARAGTT